jgi:hypothetical protein
MKNFPIILDTVAFQIRYGSGHLYYDRCGQCLLDIEQACDGWLTISADINSGRLERPDKSFNVGFNNSSFDFVAQKANNIDFKEFAQEVSLIWKIVQANLGLNEFLRVGCRFQYLKAYESIEAHLPSEWVK